MGHSNEIGMNDDLQRVSEEVAGRLAGLGIWLNGLERPEELLQIQEAVERFELAVESRGGDLMVDEGPRAEATAPDDRHFGLPRRDVDEPVDQYVERLVVATDHVRQHPSQS